MQGLEEARRAEERKKYYQEKLRKINWRTRRGAMLL